MPINNTKKKLIKYVTIVVLIITIASTCSYALVDFFGNYVVRGNYSYSPIDAIGIVIPTIIIIGLVFFFAMREALKIVLKLVDGLEKVGNGDYNAKIKMENNNDPMEDVYKSFNNMCDELNSVQILKQDFLNNFSHEFKTPITSINGFANLLLNEDIEEEKKKEYLQIIADESARLAKLSNNTLLLSKLDSQISIIDKKEYKLDEQIKKCIIVLYKYIEEKNIDLEINLEEINYNGNYEIMQHLWLNLINNSIKYTSNDGKIKIDLKECKNKIIFSIEDNGIGMNEETKRRIFEKYYQGDTSHHTKGLGIGLSIVNRIVELCEGEIYVESELGKGSKFIVKLPKK